MTRVLLLLLFLLQAVAAGPPDTVRFDFRALRVGDEPADRFTCLAGKDAFVFTPRRFLPAGPFSYHGPPQVQFSWAHAPGNVVAGIRVPPGVRQGLLFFSRYRSGPLPYRVDLVEDAPRAFPAGSLVLLNCTGRELLARVGANDLRIPPGPSPPLPCEPADGTAVQLAARTPAGLRIVFENRIEFSPRERAVLVLEPPRPEAPFRVRTWLYRERVPAGPADCPTGNHGRDGCPNGPGAEKL